MAAFVAAVGSAGMLMGVGAELQRLDPGVRIVALEPESSPVLSTGHGGAHRIDGVATGFVPPLFDRALAPDVRLVAEAQARTMARRLAAEEGVFAGTSTGMNVVGAISVAVQLGPGHRVVTVAVDSGLKYLAGDLFKA